MEMILIALGMVLCAACMLMMVGMAVGGIRRFFGRRDDR
jgi:hypothetical protein